MTVNKFKNKIAIGLLLSSFFQVKSEFGIFNKNVECGITFISSSYNVMNKFYENDELDILQDYYNLSIARLVPYYLKLSNEREYAQIIDQEALKKVIRNRPIINVLQMRDITESNNPEKNYLYCIFSRELKLLLYGFYQDLYANNGLLIKLQEHLCSNELHEDELRYFELNKKKFNNILERFEKFEQFNSVVDNPLKSIAINKESFNTVGVSFNAGFSYFQYSHFNTGLAISYSNVLHFNHIKAQKAGSRFIISSFGALDFSFGFFKAFVGAGNSFFNEFKLAVGAQAAIYVYDNYYISLKLEEDIHGDTLDSVNNRHSNLIISLLLGHRFQNNYDDIDQ